MDFHDVEYLTKMVHQQKTLANRANAYRKKNEESLDNWKGKIPMLQVVVALVENDDATRAFLTHGDIVPGRNATSHCLGDDVGLVE